METGRSFCKGRSPLQTIQTIQIDKVELNIKIH